MLLIAWNKFRHKDFQIVCFLLILALNDALFFDMIVKIIFPKYEM